MTTDSFRLYGTAPYDLVFIHGGPGARGSLAGVAQELGKTRGVLEALQTRYSIEELLSELHGQLQHAHAPVVLAGHSWGAWLGILYAARFAHEVRHLALISCPPLGEKWVPQILERRLELLSQQEAASFQKAIKILEEKVPGNRTRALQTVERLTQQTDFFEPCEYDDHALELDAHQYQTVWPQAAQMRREGELLRAAQRLACPVSVWHGRQDPHPAAGVLEPLRLSAQSPRVMLFDRCSHSPFAEKYAQTAFYQWLKEL